MDGSGRKLAEQSGRKRLSREEWVEKVEQRRVGGKMTGVEEGISVGPDARNCLPCSGKNPRRLR